MVRRFVHVFSQHYTNQKIAMIIFACVKNLENRKVENVIVGSLLKINKGDDILYQNIQNM